MKQKLNFIQKKPKKKKNKSVLFLCDEARSISQWGLSHVKDPEALERYEILLDLASRKYADVSGLKKSEVKKIFQKELGYITPKVAIAAAVFDKQGNVLLERRSDDKSWGMPGGWAENNENLKDSIKREVWEETGIKVRIKDIVDIFYRFPGEYGQPHASIVILYIGQKTGGSIKVSHESYEVGFHDWRKIRNWHKNNRDMVKKAYQSWKFKF